VVCQDLGSINQMIGSFLSEQDLLATTLLSLNQVWTDG